MRPHSPVSSVDARLFRGFGSALPIASRTIRRCTFSFLAMPAIVPTPNSYSLRTSSNNSTFALQSNESLRGGLSPASEYPFVLRGWAKINFRTGPHQNTEINLLAGKTDAAVAILGFVTWTLRHRLLRRLWKARIVTSLSLLIAAAAPAMLYYNWRVSGSPLLLPYVADQKQYAIVPLFLSQKLKPEPKYQSASLRSVYEADLRLYEKGRSAAGIPEMLKKIKDFWLFYFGPLLTIARLNLGETAKTSIPRLFHTN